MREEKNIHVTECICKSNQGLFIPNRHISSAIAGMLCFFFVTFVAGYFLGRQQRITEFTTHLENLALADHSESVHESIESNLAEHLTELDAKESKSVSQISEVKDLNVGGVKPYYAQLIGFGTSPAAHRFAQRLQKKGIAVEVKTRYSKTAKGKRISWYQVVTEPFTNRESLDQLVEQVSRSERLTGVRIVPC